MQETVNNTLLTEDTSVVQIKIDLSSPQPNDDSGRTLIKPSRLTSMHKESHRLVKQQGHITSEVQTQNLPDDVIEAVLHCLTHEADCPIAQCSCRRVKSKLSDIQVIDSGSQNDHGDTSIAAEKLEAKIFALPSICVDDIPLSDIDESRFEADDSDIIEEYVQHRRYLGTLPLYDSGLFGSNDSEDL
jgi:hypothetical protein